MAGRTNLVDNPFTGSAEGWQRYYRAVEPRNGS